jgi:NTE family protein
MDAAAFPFPPGPSGIRGSGRPDRIALVLQGGGALGAYQAGAYQALHEAGLEPDWLAGVSIGGINAAIIAGNPPERRVERLRRFWETITSRQLPAPPEGDDLRRAYDAWSAFLSLSLGQPGFFTPRIPGPWLSPRGAPGATSFYDSAPLRQTLTDLVDFDRINHGGTRFAVGAVNVASGNFIYFDNARAAIVPKHVLASAALPPALPMVRIGTDLFWDGGVVSNTPLQHLLDNADACSMLVFQVDLFSARGPVPRDMLEVLSRQKDIQYSSRTRMVTDVYRRLYDQQQTIRRLLARIPDEQLAPAEREMKARLARMPEFTILHLIYEQAAYEGEAKDYEFSAASMREHWDNGYRDTARTLLHRDWLAIPPEGAGITVHDIHREDG